MALHTEPRKRHRIRSRRPKFDAAAQCSAVAPHLSSQHSTKNLKPNKIDIKIGLKINVSIRMVFFFFNSYCFVHMFFSLRHVLLGIHLRELGMLQDGLAHAHHGIRGRQGEDGVAKLCEKTETVRDFLLFLRDTWSMAFTSLKSPLLRMLRQISWRRETFGEPLKRRQGGSAT